jgi:hypothetical protein
MKRTAKFIEALASGDEKMINDSLTAAIKEKVNTVLEIKRVAITSKIYDKAVAAK